MIRSRWRMHRARAVVLRRYGQQGNATTKDFLMIVFGSTDGAHIRVFGVTTFAALYYSSANAWPDLFRMGGGDTPEAAVRDLWRRLHG